MRWNAFNLIEPAISNTKKLLFPFNLKNWIKLTFVSLLSRFGSGGGGFRGGGSNYSKSLSSNKARNITGNAISNTFDSVGYGILGILLFFLVLIGLLIGYVTSIFSFIYIDALVNKTYSIGKSWVKNRKIGRSFFGFRIVLGLVSLLVFASIFAIPIIHVFKIGFFNYIEKTSFLTIFLDFLPFVLIFLIWFILLWIFTTFVYDFSLIEMYKKQIGIKAAIKNTFRNIRKQKLESFVYLLANIVFSLIITLIALIAVILMFIILFLVGLIIFLLFSLISKWLALGIIILFAIGGIMVILVTLLPLGVFRSYIPLLAYEKVYSEKVLKVKHKA